MCTRYLYPQAVINQNLLPAIIHVLSKVLPLYYNYCISRKLVKCLMVFRGNCQMNFPFKIQLLIFLINYALINSLVLSTMWLLKYGIMPWLWLIHGNSWVLNVCKGRIVLTPCCHYHTVAMVTCRETLRHRKRQFGQWLTWQLEAMFNRLH